MGMNGFTQWDIDWGEESYTDKAPVSQEEPVAPSPENEEPVSTPVEQPIQPIAPVIDTTEPDAPILPVAKDDKNIKYETEMHSISHKQAGVDLNEVNDLIDQVLGNEQKAVQRGDMFINEPTYIVESEPDPEVKETLNLFIDEFKMAFAELTSELEQSENTADDGTPAQFVKPKVERRVYDKKIKELEDKLKTVEPSSPEYGDIKKQINDRVKEKMGLSKVTFAKPKEETPFKKKVMTAAVVCTLISVFFGVQANSYYNYCVEMKKTPPSGMGATFMWLTVSDLPFAFIPFHGDIFISAFFLTFIIAAIIVVLAMADADTKKKARIGFEHGAARLGTSTDFKKFKTRFMENDTPQPQPTAKPIPKKVALPKVGLSKGKK